MKPLAFIRGGGRVELESQDHFDAYGGVVLTFDSVYEAHSWLEDARMAVDDAAFRHVTESEKAEPSVLVCLGYRPRASAAPLNDLLAEPPEKRGQRAARYYRRLARRLGLVVAVAVLLAGCSGTTTVTETGGGRCKEHRTQRLFGAPLIQTEDLVKCEVEP